jgi:hypothetical protein
MDKLLAKLSEQQAVISQQTEALHSSEDNSFPAKSQDHASSSNSLPVTPATDVFPSTAPTTRPASATFEDKHQDAEEVLRLKLELAQAQNQICRLDQELAQSRTIKTEPDSVDSIGQFPPRSQVSGRDGIWAAPDDNHSDTSESMSTNTFNRTRGIWGNPKAPCGNPPVQASISEPSPGNWFGGRGFNPSYPEPYAPYSNMESCRTDRLTPDSDILMRPSGGRRGNRYESRMNSPQPFAGPFGTYNVPPGQYDPVVGGSISGGPMPGPMNPVQGMANVGMGMYSQHPQAMGTPLSPYASEFTSKAVWKNEVCAPASKRRSIAHC